MEFVCCKEYCENKVSYFGKCCDYCDWDKQPKSFNEGMNSFAEATQKRFCELEVEIKRLKRELGLK